MSRFSTRALDRAFGHPRGLLGRLGGTLMAHSNAATEFQIVRLAHLEPSDHVVVIGPGPGVGLRAAGEQAAHVVGVEPSARMRRNAAQRCAELIEAGRVEVRAGTADATGLPEQSFDAVLTVNNTHLWPARRDAFTELHRLLRPGGLLLLSTHERWLEGGRMALHNDAHETGFVDIQTWAWQPPGRGVSIAAQLRARRPA